MFLPSPLFLYHFPHRRCIGGNVTAIVFSSHSFHIPPSPHTHLRLPSPKVVQVKIPLHIYQSSRLWARGYVLNRVGGVSGKSRNLVEIAS